MNQSNKKVFTPRAKFMFSSESACIDAQESLNKTHPNLMTSKSLNGFRSFLFVQSYDHRHFDGRIRNLMEKLGGTFEGIIT